MRKNKKVSSVIGWLLSFQLKEPGVGVCCAVSIVRDVYSESDGGS
jgi:hypothetical protein